METFLKACAQALFLFAPLLVSAGLSALVMHLDLLALLKRPIDAGKTFRGQRLFGDNKTWRGLALTILGCTAAVALQKTLLWPWAQRIALLDYGQVNVLLLGLTLGCGVSIGELPNSFAKRQMKIPSGQTTTGPLCLLFYFLDQIDLLIVTWPLLLFWVRPSWQMVAASFLLVLLIHPMVSLIGYLIGVRTSAR